MSVSRGFDKVRREDWPSIQRGVDALLKHLPVVPPTFDSSPWDGYNRPPNEPQVVPDAKVPNHAQFTLKEMEGLLAMGFFVTKIATEFGSSRINEISEVKVRNLTDEALAADFPIITHAAIHASVNGYCVEDNIGRSLVQQRKYAAEYGEKIAKDIGAEGRVIGIVPSMSMQHEGLARMYRESGELPIDDNFPYLRLEGPRIGVLGMVMRVDTFGGVPGLRLAQARVDIGTRVVVSNNDAENEKSIVAWPFIVPRGAIYGMENPDSR